MRSRMWWRTTNRTCTWQLAVDLVGVLGSNSLSLHLWWQVLTSRKLTIFCGPSSWPVQEVATDRRQGTTKKAVTMATGSTSSMAWSEEWIRLFDSVNVVGWSGPGSYLFWSVLWNQLKCRSYVAVFAMAIVVLAWFPACMLVFDAVCIEALGKKKEVRI